jgi:hypothetical protein
MNTEEVVKPTPGCWYVVPVGDNGYMVAQCVYTCPTRDEALRFADEMIAEFKKEFGEEENPTRCN